MSRLHATRNDLPESSRKELIGVLNDNLADAIHVTLQAKQAHWNVKGPDFIQLHELFDKLYLEASQWVDLVAERAVQLGGVADGTLGSLPERSHLPDYGLELTSGREHVDQMVDSVAVYAGLTRKAIAAAEKSDDADTADLFTEISRGADKMLWFLEAHLQADR